MNKIYNRVQFYAIKIASVKLLKLLQILEIFKIFLSFVQQNVDRFLII